MSPNSTNQDIGIDVVAVRGGDGRHVARWLTTSSLLGGLRPQTPGLGDLPCGWWQNYSSSLSGNNGQYPSGTFVHRDRAQGIASHLPLSARVLG